MAGRPRTFDKDAAVDRLLEVFWDTGFEGASIDALQTAVGVKRGSFYAAWSDKEAAFRAAMGRYVDTVVSANAAILNADAPPRDRLGAFIRRIGEVMAGERGRGCLLCMAMEPPDNVSALTAEALNTASSTILAPVAQAAREAGAETELSAYVVAGMMGLSAMSRARAEAEHIRLAAELMARSLEQSAAG